jgi:hypothetical protein
MSSLAKGRSPGLSLVELRWREKLAPIMTALPPRPDLSRGVQRQGRIRR